MRKCFYAITVIALSIFSLSCSSDDNDSNNNASLQGTWKLTAWNVGESFDLNNDGTASANLLDEMDCYNNETIIFAESNVATYVSTSYADIYAELEAGSTTEYDYTIECIMEMESSDAIYTQNGNVVTLTIDGDVTLIATIDGDTLSFVVPDGYYIEDDEFNVVVEQDLTFVFTKQ